MNPDGNRVQCKPVLPVGVLVKRKTNTPVLPERPEVIMAGPEASVLQPSSNSGQIEPCLQMSSSCGDGEGRADRTAGPSRFNCDECATMLHELSNVMTGVLTTAQLLSWKLPPYSHLKRSVREVERGAQRGGELLRRLKERCSAQP